MPAQSAAATTQHTPSSVYIRWSSNNSPTGFSFFLTLLLPIISLSQKVILDDPRILAAAHIITAPAKNTSLGGITFTKTAVPLRYLRNYMTLSERFSYFFSKETFGTVVCSY